MHLAQKIGQLSTFPSRRAAVDTRYGNCEFLNFPHLKSQTQVGAYGPNMQCVCRMLRQKANNLINTVMRFIRAFHWRAANGEERLWKVWWMAGIPVGWTTSALVVVAEQMRYAGCFASAIMSC